MYALSRIFKRYDIYKDNPAGAFQPVESKNIVIYAGDGHAQNYIDFLEFIGNVRRTYSFNGSEEVSCVKLWEYDYNPSKEVYCNIL